MKKIISSILAAAMLLTTNAMAYYFPTPDWGALLQHRRSMVNEKEFELYVEGSPDLAPYYGARLEPRSGVYLGAAGELQPFSSVLTYIEYPETTSYYTWDNPDKLTLVALNTGTMDVDYDVIRRTVENISKKGQPTLVRFANEMNCSALGNEPDQYKEVFRNVANIIHEYDNLAVVWSPNDMGSLDRPFDYYWPGEEYVDWIGVSCYLTKEFNHVDSTTEKDSVYFMTGPYAWTTNKFKPLMEFLTSNNIQKPLMISEGGVERTNRRGEDMTGWHEPRLRGMLWNTLMKYPQVKMINYFDVVRPEAEVYAISDFPESVSIYNEASQSGAYKRSISQNPDFAFAKANEGGTLVAKNGIVNLYTLAYIPNNPDIYVNYYIDGEWKHSSNQIPYKYALDINTLSDGAHSFKIDSAGETGEYTLYKNGGSIRFGAEPEYSAPAQDNIKVLLDGIELQFDQPPVIQNGRTLVPLRAIFENLGADVDWDDNTKTVLASDGNTTLKLTIGDDIIYIKEGNKSEERITLDVPAQIINSRTMVPIRAISEAFGANVGWDGDSRTITIE